ncbi:MAG: TfoX/Sxy family protein [Candidatus Bathyarchaeota archaeon]|nr:MAG: TfoX/Sxy family protein [Candidatus Bathyarchaeota archaeon]
MVYNEQIADRIRKALRNQPGIVERKMFGGLAFLLYGNMCCGVLGERVMIRTGPDFYETALQKPHVTPMDFTGRIMRNFVVVGPDGLQSDEELSEWIGYAISFALSLPRKER